MAMIDMAVPLASNLQTSTAIFPPRISRPKCRADARDAGKSYDKSFAPQSPGLNPSRYGVPDLSHVYAAVPYPGMP